MTAADGDANANGSYFACDLSRLLFQNSNQALRPSLRPAARNVLLPDARIRIQSLPKSGSHAHAAVLWPHGILVILFCCYSLFCVKTQVGAYFDIGLARSYFDIGLIAATHIHLWAVRRRPVQAGENLKSCRRSFPLSTFRFGVLALKFWACRFWASPGEGPLFLLDFFVFYGYIHSDTLSFPETSP